MKSTKDRLAELMEKFDMRQHDLCEKTGISRTMISLYCSGKRKPKQDNIFIIANAFKIDPVWLLGFDVPMYKENNIPKEEQQRIADMESVFYKYECLNDKYQALVKNQVDMLFELQMKDK